MHFIRFFREGFHKGFDKGASKVNPQEHKHNLAERRLKDLSKLTMRELMEKFDIKFNKATKDPEGLSDQQVIKKTERFGANEITIASKETTLTRIFDALVNPFNIVLFIIAIISYVADVFGGEGIDWTTITLIMIMIGVASPKDKSWTNIFLFFQATK
jgi:magnesium-transporting ATPase (P-type)